MAKKLKPKTHGPTMPEGDNPAQVTGPSAEKAVRDYDLVGDVVFDPPMSPDELRRRFKYGVPIEERIAQVERQILAGEDEWEPRASRDADRVDPGSRQG